MCFTNGILEIMQYKSRKNELFTISMYNVENLFDTTNDPNTIDDDFTPTGRKRWTDFRYRNKIKKLSSVISVLGSDKSTYAPALVGLVEIENQKVIEDLINSKYLKKHQFDYVHYDSSDERGIDVALLYQKQFFNYEYSKTFEINFVDESGELDYTRDILLVKGSLLNETVYVIVNHWASRREGVEKSEPKRIQAAALVRKIMDEVKFNDPNAKFIVMGDFNDDPIDRSIKELVKDDLFNPMKKLFIEGNGSLSFNNNWNLFDQIIFSKNFFDSGCSLSFIDAEIFSKDWLKIKKGKLKGLPFRTYIGPWYKGGFSDHFPVNVFFKLEL